MAPLAIGNKRCNRDEDLSTAWVAQLMSLKDPYGPRTGNVQWSKSSATALWRGRTGVAQGGFRPARRAIQRRGDCGDVQPTHGRFDQTRIPAAVRRAVHSALPPHGRSAPGRRSLLRVGKGPVRRAAGARINRCGAESAAPVPVRSRPWVHSLGGMDKRGRDNRV